MRSFRDLGVVEDAVQDAFVRAAETWPRDGVPPNPQAWIVLTARRRALDALRHRATGADVADRIVADAARTTHLSVDDALDDELNLVLLCAHPALSPEAQVTLTLRFVGGLSVDDIARLFGAKATAISARLTRAKAAIHDAGIGMDPPDPARRRERVDAALAVTYGVYTAGHTATSGAELLRGDLLDEGLHLARHVATLAPHDPEAQGLLALILLLDARRDARTAPDGSLVDLSHQDRRAWDREKIAEGQRIVLACIRRATPGPYQLQAAIQAVHSAAASAAETDWTQILANYDVLAAEWPSTAVTTARAVAVAEVHGPDAGLAALGTLDDRYALAVRADLFARLGRDREAREAFLAAASLTDNAREDDHLRRRARDVGDQRAAPTLEG